MTLQEVLGTNYQICRQFHEYCKKEFNLENLRFALAVRQLQNMPCAFPWLPTELTTPEKIQHVYDSFIPEGAPQQVNLNDRNRNNLISARNSLNARSFDAARVEIEGLMNHDVFGRFARKAGIEITDRPAAAAAAQPVIVTVVVPPSAPVLHLVNSEAPARRPSAPPPVRHHQLPPPPNALVAPPAAPQTPVPDGVPMRYPKPGPHLRNRQQPAAAPPPLPPLPERYKMKVKNVYIVASAASSASASSSGS